MSRSTFPITFGGGIDRATGTTASSPASMEVAENVVLMRGRVTSRKGNEVRSNLGGADYVAGIHADRNTLRSVFVAGFGTPGTSGHRLEIWAGTGSGRDAAKVADWIDPCESVERARVIAAQSGPYVILAHDEPSIDRRAHTVAVNLEAGTVTDLTASWADDDDRLRFRGVCTWLDYLVGWGFGTNAVHEPHMVRISDVADPLTFQEDAYNRVGQSGDAVLVCYPSRVGVGGSLLIRKQTDVFMQTGDSFDNFGLTQVETMYGLAAPRLAVSDGVTDWFWSLEGPRESRGGASVDISWPLGLYPWPTAQDIAAEGLVDQGFAVYQPKEALVRFVFVDYVYTYSLERKEWSHDPLSTPVHCGAILYARSGYEGASRGYPDYVSAVAADADSYTITWADISPEGDETVEVWVKRQADAWGVSPSETASITLAPSVVVDGLFSGDHDVAIRYKRDGLYSDAGDVTGFPSYDYTGVPGSWPAISRGTFTVATPTPTLSSLVWSRVDAGTERIAVTYAGGGYPVQILRNTVDNVGTATIIHTSAGTAGTYNDDAPGAGETTVYYYVRNVFPDTSTGTASAAYPRWIGPDKPVAFVQDVISMTYPADFYEYTVTWTAPPSGYATTVEDDYLCDNVFVARGTTAADAVLALHTVQKDSALSEDGTEVSRAVDVRGRHEVTQFAVLDYSDWSTVAAVVRVAIDETAWHSCP